MPSLGHVAGAFLTAAILSLIATPVVRALAFRTKMVATPKQDRWNRRVVALLGGVAIVTATLISAFAWGAVDAATFPVVVGAVLMFGVGLYDDYIRLKPSTKLIAQLAIASALVWAGSVLAFTGRPVLDALLTVFWFVGVTNAFNLLDNMDGLCGGVALVASLSFTASLMTAPPGLSTSPAVLGAVLAGALAGFLRYNFHPASIFMGDSGSLFVGFLLAGMMTLASTAGATVISALAWPALIMLTPIFDTTFVTLSRKLSGRAASQGGTDHTSHRLVALGFSERRAVLMLCSLAAAAGATAVALRAYGFTSSVALVGVLLLCTILLGAVLARVHVYEDQDFAALKQGTLTPLVIEFVYKRRVIEVILDFFLVTLAYWAAYRLRWEGEIFDRHMPYFVKSLPIVLAFKMVAFFVSGVYRGTWRYFGLYDLPVFIRGIALGSIGAIMWLVFTERFEGYSRSVFVIDAMVLTLLMVGARVWFRALGEYGSHGRASGRRVVIYGAGDGGNLAVRELLNNPKHGYKPIGFVDDEPSKHHRRILGLAVLGGGDRILPLMSEGVIDGVVLSTAKIRPDRLAAIERLCRERGAELIRIEFGLRTVTEGWPARGTRDGHGAVVE